MSDEVEVPFGDSASDTAVLLLEAAQALDLPADVVKTTGGGGFIAPAEVVDRAGLNKNKADSKDDSKDSKDDKPPAKKAAAKKTASKE